MESPRFAARSAGRAEGRVRALWATLAISLSLSFVQAAQAAVPEQERNALIALYNSLWGINWLNKTGWLGPAGSECSWYGVACDGAESTVIRLSLANNFTAGYIPDEIINLTNLQTLDLRDNRMYLSVPAALGNLRKLEALDLSGNYLSGPIPPELGNLSQLRVLRLNTPHPPWNPGLWGQVPPELGNLSKLEILELGGNLLNGSIPVELGRLTNLKHLNLAGNPIGGSLSGSIPSLLGNLRNLQTLRLQNNLLSGSIPPAIGDLENLQSLDLHSNQLTGVIPSDLIRLAQLQFLALSYNQLDGNIPAAISHLGNLQSLDLSNNRLTGLIPAEFMYLANLQSLDLSQNQLNGSLPGVFSNLRNLRVLRLSGNRLSGNMSPTWGTLTNLQTLALDNNDLSGRLPAEFGNLRNIQILELRRNHLSGSIPSSWGSLPNLLSLGLSENQLGGAIPPELGNLPVLESLALDGNQLRGRIPSNLASLAMIRTLELGYNALYADDPDFLSFLYKKNSLWDTTQTVAPSDVSARTWGNGGIFVSWQSIPFSDYPGRYEVWLSTTNGGPYTLAGSTPDKKSSSLTLTGLDQGTTYYAVVKTVTDPHLYNFDTAVNQNTVVSEFSAQVSAGIPRVSLDLTLSAGGAAGSTTSVIGGPTQAGYAAVNLNSGGASYGTAVFAYSENGVTVSEAAVPASPPTTSTLFFVDYRTGATIPGSSGMVDVCTGFAVANPGAGPATITYTLRGLAGDVIARGRGRLDKGAHLARFVHQLPDEAPGFLLPPSFPTSIGFGTLQLSSDLPLSVVALRLTTNQRGDSLMTSIPTADQRKPPVSAPVYFAQFADGGGYSTSLILLNTSSSVETGAVRLFADDGSPLVVQQLSGPSGSSFTYSIMPGGAWVFQTDGSPPGVRSGWAELNPIGGTPSPIAAGIFQYSQAGVLVTESGIPSAVPTTHARIFVDLSGGHNTGLALGNPGLSPISISMNAFQMDGTTSVGTSKEPVALGGQGHSAVFVDQRVAGLPQDFQGVLDMAGESPFVALTIRSLVNERGDFLITNFPVADMNRTAPSPIVFPQIAAGGGYTTNLVLMSSGSAGAARIDFFDDAGRPLAIGR